MKLAQKIILAVGAAVLGYLLWKMDAGAVWHLVAQIGWGFVLILGQETVAHAFNTVGWRFSYRDEHAPSYKWRELFRLRIVGDGVNYLTPSATIAGEFARATLLNDSQPSRVRMAGVVLGKCLQSFAQGLFILFGLALVVRGKIPWLRPFEWFIQAVAALTALAIMAWVILGRWSPRFLFPAKAQPEAQEKSASALRAVGSEVRSYFSESPSRCIISMLFFMAGYSWGAFEVYWICRFIGVPVAPGTAMAIEVLSNLIDGVCFMVPAKVGTQEAGKTAIFRLLGLPAVSGLALGVVRHLRELAWASLGFALYYQGLKSNALSRHCDSGRDAVLQP